MNKTMIFKLSLVLSALIKVGTLHASFFKEQAEGWHWYHHLPPLVAVEKPTEEIPNALALFKTPSEWVKAYQKDLEERLHRAFVFPSFENVKAYQVMQQDLMQRAEQFAKIWMQVVYQNPGLDQTLSFPVSHRARQVYLDLQKADREAKIKALAQDYGLLFFFDSACHYCRSFAPIVKQFATDYGFRVLAISSDGQGLPEFLEAQSDNGLMQQLKIEVFPTLLAIHPKTQHIVPLSYGLTSLDHIEERSMILITRQKEKI